MKIQILRIVVCIIISMSNYCVLNFSGMHSVYLNWRAFWQYWTVKRKSTLTKWGPSIVWWKSTWRSDCRVSKPKRNMLVAQNVLRCLCDGQPAYMPGDSCSHNGETVAEEIPAIVGSLIIITSITGWWQWWRIMSKFMTAVMIRKWRRRRCNYVFYWVTVFNCGVIYLHNKSIILSSVFVRNEQEICRNVIFSWMCIKFICKYADL